MMKNLFRTRPPRHLTLPQLNRLSTQSNITPTEVQKWYERFVRCYTSGYVSLNEFEKYIRQVYLHQGLHREQMSKSLMKEIYSTLDINRDQELNFEEFFRFSLLINLGSIEEKLKFILTLYRREREVQFTREEIARLLTTMFKFFDMSKSMEKLDGNIDEIFRSINANQRIGWNTFCTTVLNQLTLFELQPSNPVSENSPGQI